MTIGGTSRFLSFFTLGILTYMILLTPCSSYSITSTTTSRIVSNINQYSNYVVQRRHFSTISKELTSQKYYHIFNNRRKQVVVVQVSDTNSSEGVVSQEKPESVLTQSYRYLQYGFTIASIIIFLIPYQLSVPTTITTTTHKSLLPTKLGASVGYAIAAKLCTILRHANIEQRLSSDTYKRLNIGLFGFTSIGLFAIPGEAGFLSSTLLSRCMIGYLTLLRLFSCIVTYIGWKQNISNNIAPFKELWNGTIETIKGLKVQSAKKALTYRNCFFIVCFGILSSFMEGLFYIRYQNDFMLHYTNFHISLQWSSMARLFMISSMIYTLKDAAERDRLTGSTFIELNILIGCWASIIGFGQAILYPFGFAGYKGVEMFTFAIPFFLKAYKSHREKKIMKQTKLK